MPRLLLDNVSMHMFVHMLPLAIVYMVLTSHIISSQIDEGNLLTHESRSGNEINRKDYYDNFNTPKSYYYIILKTPIGCFLVLALVNSMCPIMCDPHEINLHYACQKLGVVMITCSNQPLHDMWHLQSKKVSFVLKWIRCYGFSLSSLWLRPTTLQGSRGQVSGKSTNLEGNSSVHHHFISTVFCNRMEPMLAPTHIWTLIGERLHIFQILAIIGSTHPQQNWSFDSYMVSLTSKKMNHESIYGCCQSRMRNC